MGASLMLHSIQDLTTEPVMLDEPGWGPRTCSICWLASHPIAAREGLVLNSPVPAAERGCSFTRPAQARGCTWAGPSQARGRTWAGPPSQCTGSFWTGSQEGSTHSVRAQGRHCRPPPAHLLVRADPEHLRAEPELTNSSSWTELSPQASLCAASLHWVFQRLLPHLGTWPVSTHLPLLPNSRISLMRRRVFLKLSPTCEPVKRIRKRARAAAPCLSRPSGPHTWSLYTTHAARPVSCNHDPLMGESLLT